jgi:hypothetical protein
MYMKQFLFFSIFFFQILSQAFSQNYIQHKGNDIFLSGINLAWMDFGNDLTNFDVERFRTIMQNVSDAGGNSVRWWIHIDGRSTPTYENDTIVGISETALNNLGTALDIAAEHQIVISLCLWSFDMMHSKKDEESDAVALDRLTKNRILLEDSAATQAYIDKALIPMVERFAGHTAILCWEIFNEPEGMTTIGNWSHIENVDIHYIQRFINRCAGAIHRADPEAKVSNGSWNAKATVDIEAISSTNYYSDEALIAAGGDAAGTLDFYMMHFYPQYSGDKYSPFHNPVTFWELDKPLLIGEYSAHGIIDDGAGFAPSSELSATESLAFLFDNGYAGGWGWTYTNHDGHGGLSDMRYVMDSLQNTYPELITIPRDPNHNYAPKHILTIPDTVLYVNSNPIEAYVNLNDFFEDETPLTYVVSGEGPVIPSLFQDSILSLNLVADSIGVIPFIVEAIDTGGKTVSTQFNVLVRDSLVDSDNHLLYSIVSASSSENEERRRVSASDGDMQTRWSSAYNDDEWIQFDMLSVHSISRIVLYWEAAYGDVYDILLSTDAQQWDTVMSVGRGAQGVNNFVIPQTDARYIKIQFHERATQWGYSLFEVEAYTDNGEFDNVGPESDCSLSNININLGYSLNYSVSLNRFTDENNDVLQFSAERPNGDPLSDWLSFEPFTHSLSGTPEIQDTGVHYVRIIATDWFGETSCRDLSFTVPKPTGLVYVHKTEMNVFPNPTQSASSLVLSFDSEISTEAQVLIINSIGVSVVKTKVPIVDGTAELMVTQLPKGVYVLSVQTDEEVYVQKLIIQ